MKNSVVFLFMIFIFLFLSSFKTLKEAYQEEGVDVFGETHWIGADMPVRYWINELGSADISGDGEFTAINNAFNTWTSVNCGTYRVGLRVEYLGKTSERVGYFDGKNTIDFVESKSEWPPEAGANAIAFTLPSIREDGIIVEADIRFNGVNYTWSTSGGYGRMDVETIALHELGHFFGLADLYDNYSCYTIQAVMCGYGSGGTKRTLKQDDKDGICYLYNPNKYYECTRISDCKDGFVCRPYVNIEGKTTTYCLEPYCLPSKTNDPYCNNPLNTKAVEAGFRCGDINNTPLNTGDDIPCKNRMCLPSGVCSGVCVNDSDCPKNMKCEMITIEIEENTLATLKGCNTPPGCVNNRECKEDKVCTPYRAGSALISVCNNNIGPKNIGESCTSNTECKTGLCYNNYCTAFCSLNSDCTIYGYEYSCTKDISITYDGLTEKFSICTRANVISDAGFDIILDAPIDVNIPVDVQMDVSSYDIVDVNMDYSGDIFDSTVTDTNRDIDIGKDVYTGDVTYVYDTILYKDAPRIDIFSECVCDETYGCDPDCDCDPDCTEEYLDNTSGCSCNLIN